MNRGLIAEVDLGAIAHNLGTVKQLSHGRPVIAVVKANAYGHGALEVSKELVHQGVEYLAVAFAGEAKELRESGITAPLLVLFDPDAEDVLTYDLVPVIADAKQALHLSRQAEKAHRMVKIHIKVDTGMGRLGICADATKEIFEIASLKGITVEGVMSHFSEADLADLSYAHEQLGKIRTLKEELHQKGLAVRFFHISNSAAVQTLPEAHLDAVRPGIMLYGYSSLERQGSKQQGQGSRVKGQGDLETALIPAMALKARIVSIRRLPQGTPISYGRSFITKRDSVIGVMSAGYADGFCRRFSNNAEVLVKGRRVPVVGRVCMDLSMIDLTDLAKETAVDEEDEVIIIGRQGSDSIDASEIAQKAGTISYEILTSLGSKAKKRYTNADSL